MIRNGLSYRRSHDYGGPVYVYTPAEPFTVDGIEYKLDQDLYCYRPMIEVFEDGGGDGADDWSVQYWSRAIPGPGWLR